jgi:hypothetical protein
MKQWRLPTRRLAELNDMLTKVVQVALKATQRRYDTAQALLRT